MTPAELLVAIDGETPRIIRRTIRVYDVDGDVTRYRLSELSRLPHRLEATEVLVGHRLGRALDSAEIDRLEAKLGVVLPADVRAMVAVFDGVHLWCDLPDGRGYLGIAPLAEWVNARDEFGVDLGPGMVVVSYHRDGSAQLVLDVAASVVFEVDPAGPDLTTPVARSASELLQWLWRQRGEAT